MTAATKSCPMCGEGAPVDMARCQCGYIFASGKASGEAAGPVLPAVNETATGGGWQVTGWAFALIGTFALVYSTLMKTSVATSSLYGAASEVVNLDLQFHKGLAVAGSLFAIGLGVFCLGISAVVKAISQASRPQ